jgi:hypothetical protein
MSATRWVVKAAVTAGLGLLFGATPALADWGYTQWGMSPAEVKLASRDQAQDNPDRSLDAEGLKAELVAPYEGDTLAFTAVFLFDDASRLQYVSLNPSGSAVCPRVMQHLASHYGPPEGAADMVDARTMRWDDVTGDNLVVFLDLGQGGCSVQYSKLPATRPNGKGL